MLIEGPPSSDHSGIIWGAVLGFVGTLIGFGLNELSYILRQRREDRQKLGNVLAELLELRLHQKIIPSAMERFRAIIPAAIPAVVEVQIRAFFGSLLPRPDALSARYEKAVTEVAGAFPALAFTLRSKDMLSPFLVQYGV